MTAQIVASRPYTSFNYLWSMILDSNLAVMTAEDPNEFFDETKMMNKNC